MSALNEVKNGSKTFRADDAVLWWQFAEFHLCTISSKNRFISPKGINIDPYYQDFHRFSTVMVQKWNSSCSQSETVGTHQPIIELVEVTKWCIDLKGTKKNDDDSINEGHQKRQPLLNSNYVFLPLMYLNTIGNEIKSNLLSVVCATHQGIFYRYNLCYRANKIMMMVSSRLIIFHEKK